MTPTALITPHGSCHWLARGTFIIIMDSTLMFLVVNTRGVKNSLMQVMKFIMHNVDIIGLRSGNIMRKNAPITPVPSIHAASSSEGGIWDIYAENIITEKGMTMERYSNTKPDIVSVRFSVCQRTMSGTTVTVPGIIADNNSPPNAILMLRDLARAKAYAAIEHKIVLINSVSVDNISVSVMNCLVSVDWSSRIRKFSSVHSTDGIYLTGILNKLSGVANEDITIQYVGHRITKHTSINKSHNTVRFIIFIFIRSVSSNNPLFYTNTAQ